MNMEFDNSDYAQKLMAQMVEATGVPNCFICGKRIVGAHVDYMDKDRTPRKICIGCTFKSIDYYLVARDKALVGGESK
jgi:hypothetical protein